MTLPPGGWSSQRHWHSNEDEFVYVLEGELTLIDDGGEMVLRAGDCATFPKGTGNGHHRINRFAAMAVYRDVGSRNELQRRDGLFVHEDGTPYPKSWRTNRWGIATASPQSPAVSGSHNTSSVSPSFPCEAKVFLFRTSRIALEGQDPASIGDRRTLDIPTHAAQDRHESVCLRCSSSADDVDEPAQRQQAKNRGFMPNLG